MPMKHVTAAAELKEITDAERLLVVHADKGWLEPLSQNAFDFFTKLAPHMETKGIATVTVELDSPLSDAMLQQPHLHLIFGDRPQYRMNTLHVSPAYLWGFWYLDEVGINANSTMRMRKFCPNDVDWGHAEWFWNGVTSHMLNNNISRLTQEERVRYDLEPATAVIFAQDIEDRFPRPHYISTEDIVQNTVRAAQGGRVYVKPHPWAREDTTRKLREICEHEPNLVITDASVHDLVQVSDWVITQNSSAGFEALMQRKPVITCGRSDFHHATIVARSGDELRDIIKTRKGEMDAFEYEKYLYWFLSDHCVEPQREDFAELVWNRLRDKAMI